MIIEDGTGTGRRVKVDSNNRLWTRAIVETEAAQATEDGDGYNINTGAITITGSTEIATLYIKNNESRDHYLTSFAVGLGTGSASNPAEIKIIRAPTLGTIIDDANNVDMNQNRNVNSSKTLTALAYKGSLGSTFTDGNDVALFFQSYNSRLFADVDLIIPQGVSIGISIKPNLSSGESLVYIAAICHIRKDSDV